MVWNRARGGKAEQGARRGERKDAQQIESYSSPKTRHTDENASFVFSAFLFVVTALAVLGIGYAALGTVNIWLLTGALVLAVLVIFTVHVAPQWERVVILRLGKYQRTAGPGPYLTIPFIDHVSLRADQRTMLTGFGAEETLTADLVPVNVDAAVFWMVWDAEKACLEVENYPKAVLRSAQTAMRDVIGQLNLADISMRRKQIDRDLEEILGKKCEQWGVTVMSVEIRDIMIPKELQDALSKEAQAERERNARIILAEVEKDISEMFVEAAEVYDRNPRAMKLRAMNLAYEGAKDSKGVLLAPSALADGFNIGQAGGGE